MCFRWTYEHKDRVLLYGDDLLLYIQHANISLPRVIQMLQIYGVAPGLQVNGDKTIFVPEQEGPPKSLSHPHIKVAGSHFKYLGMWVTRCADKGRELNITPLLRHSRRKLDGWISLPLTMTGRSAPFEMISIPRFQYMLQNFPFPLPPNFFTARNPYEVIFLWNGVTPRVISGKARNCNVMAV